MRGYRRVAPTRQEHQTSNASAHAIDSCIAGQHAWHFNMQKPGRSLTLEDNRVRLKVEIKDRIRQSKIQGRQRNNRLVKNHAEWSCHRDDKHLPNVAALHLQRRHNGGVPGILAELLRATRQNNGAIGFGHEDDQGQGGAGADEADPKTPPPTHDGHEPGDPGAHDGAEGGALEVVSNCCSRPGYSRGRTAM